MRANELRTDCEGSYLLGEADGEIWFGQVHPNEVQGLCLLSPDEVGQRDIFGQESAAWLRDQAETYVQRDPKFDAYSYYEGFLTSVRRSRRASVFATIGDHRRC